MRPRTNADSVALDLLGQLVHHVDLARVGATFDHAVHQFGDPACTFSAWRALTTGFVLVELSVYEHNMRFVDLMSKHNGPLRI